MYRRYSQTGDGGMPLSQINRNRIKNIIIFLLLAALAAMLVISLPLMKNQGNSRSVYIQMIQKEFKEAAADSQTLSRTAGADSAATLSRVRSNLHTIRAVNSLSNATGNGQLLPDNQLQALQSMVDQYLVYLTTGMETGKYTTDLQNALGELETSIGNLIE